MIKPKDEENGDSGVQSGNNSGSQSGEDEKKNGAALSVPSAGLDEADDSKKATSAVDDDSDTSDADSSEDGGEDGWFAVGAIVAFVVGFFWYTNNDSGASEDPLYP